MSCRRGLTRVELVVVAFIILLLVALLVPSIQRSSNISRRQLCSSHLQQLGIALATYDDAYRTFPPGGTARDENPALTFESVHGILIPFCEEGGLKSFYREGDWREQMEQAPRIVIPLYNCPSSDGENPILDKLRNELLAVEGSPFRALKAAMKLADPASTAARNGGR